MIRKKRINVSDEVFDKLHLMAKEAKVNGSKPNEKVENYFNNMVFFGRIDEIQLELAKLEDENKHLNSKVSLIDEVQLQRIEKLQALSVLDGKLSDAIKTLINSFIETNAASIQEAASKI